MAASGGAETLLNGLKDDVKRVLVEYTRFFLPNLRIGPLETAKAENFSAFKITSTSGTSTGEFSVEHGMGRTPYLAIPVVDLSAVGSRFLQLSVTRAADDRRIYLKPEAGSTNAMFSIYVE